ncbi:transposase [Bradyrhizobium sp. USDA 4516]
MPILEHGADTLQRVEIITGTGRRRRWSTDAKATIVAESFAPGASVSVVARRHDISPSLLFLWRRQSTPAQVAEHGDRGMPLALSRSRSPAVAARGRSRRRSRLRSARFVSVSEGQSTGRYCARCWRRSGRLVDDRASSWVVDLDCDAAGRFPPRHGLAGDAGERGL